MGFFKDLGNVGKQLLGAVPILGGLYQGKVAADVARENTDKTIAANKAMAEYQYSKDLEMWNRGNVYNSPLAQMGRLKAAGLNPNMVYGSGSAAGMASGQLPKFNAPTAQYNYLPPVDIPDVIAKFQDFRMRSAQIRNTDQVYKERVMPIENYETGRVVPRYEVEAGEKLSKLGWDARQSKAEWYRKREPEWVHLPRYQKEALEANIRQQGLKDLQIIAATKNLDLRNEYYAAEAISRLFGGVVGSGARVLGMLKKAPKGKLLPGTISNQEKRMRALEMGSYYGSQRYK